jgi:putative sterol carrier protein
VKTLVPRPSSRMWALMLLDVSSGPVARWLTTEWLAAVGRAAAGSAELREASRGLRLTLQQRVTGPDGEKAFHVRFEDGEIEVREGDAERPDVTFSQDRDTAEAIARGRLSAQSAFMAGRLQVSGDVPLLVRHREAFAAFASALEPVRAATEY